MLEDIQRTLGRIEGKIDSLMEAKKDHGNRIRWLEIKYWMTAGGLVVGGFILKVIHVI